MKALNILMNTAIIAVSLLAFEAVSEARRDYSACNDLPAADKTACNAAAHAKCDGLSGYWPQERCAQAIAPNFNICEKDGTYEKACQASNRARVICQSMELDMYKPESILEFKRRVLALPEVIQKEERFAANWGSCFGKTQCYASAKQLGHCKSAGDAYRKSFATVVDFYLGSGLEQQLKHVNTFMASGDFHAAKSSADQVLEKLAVLQEISKDVSFVRHRSAHISAAITKLKLRKVDVDKAYQKTLAKVRCPAGKNNNRKVLKKLRPAVTSFFHSTRDTKTTVKKFKLNGRKSTTRNAYRKETTVSYPGYACTEKVKTNETFCQVFSISVKRTKVDGSPWGKWRTFVGASNRMLCNNLK